MVECLPLDPAAQVRIAPRAVGIFLHPVTFGGQYDLIFDLYIVECRNGPRNSVAGENGQITHLYL